MMKKIETGGSRITSARLELIGCVRWTSRRNPESGQCDEGRYCSFFGTRLCIIRLSVNCEAYTVLTD